MSVLAGVVTLLGLEAECAREDFAVGFLELLTADDTGELQIVQFLGPPYICLLRTRQVCS